MKTEDLVSALSTGAEPVDLRLPSRRWLLALTGGALIAFLLTAALLKLNPALWHETSKPMFWVRESYCAVLGVLGFITVVRLARPGFAARFGPHRDPRRSDRDVGSCSSDPGGRIAAESSTTDSWAYRRGVCPFLIALSRAPLLIALLWVMRSLAPTRLHWTGAASGFAAGSIGALVYTLHCPELAAPFLGTWYLLGMLIPTALGAWLGPRLLRW